VALATLADASNRHRTGSSTHNRSSGNVCTGAKRIAVDKYPYTTTTPPRYPNDLTLQLWHGQAGLNTPVCTIQPDGAGIGEIEEWFKDCRINLSSRSSVCEKGGLKASVLHIPHSGFLGMVMERMADLMRPQTTPGRRKSWSMPAPELEPLVEAVNRIGTTWLDQVKDTSSPVSEPPTESDSRIRWGVYSDIMARYPKDVKVLRLIFEIAVQDPLTARWFAQAEGDRTNFDKTWAVLVKTVELAGDQMPPTPSPLPTPSTLSQGG
jgi:hypothetical protein